MRTIQRRAYHFDGRLPSLAVRCSTGAPSPRYHLLVLTAGEPVTAGRELPLADCRALARDLDRRAAAAGGWDVDPAAVRQLVRERDAEAHARFRRGR